MANTLIAHYQQKHNGLVTRKQTAQATFNAVSAQLKIEQEAHTALVDNNTELTSDIAKKRVQLASPSNMPADIEALAMQLRDLLIDRRHNTALLLEAEQHIDELQAQLDQLGEALNRLSKALSAAAGDLATAQRRGAQHADWVSAEVNDLISDLKNQAQALLNVDSGMGTVDPDGDTGLMDKARDRVNDDIPELLRSRARVRRAAVSADLARQRTLVAALKVHQRNQAVSVSADVGLLARRWAEYQEAEAALSTHAVSLGGELNRALNLFSSIVASARLTDPEKTRIDAVALTSDSDPITTEIALSDARAAVAAQALVLQLAITAALVSDIDADPMSDTTVQDERNELDTLEAALATAKSTHAPHGDALDTWEGAVPDAIWANLHNYDQAIAALNKIVSSDGTALENAFTSAENALVLALSDIDTHQRLTARLADDTAVAESALESLASSAAARQLSATRGDF